MIMKLKQEIQQLKDEVSISTGQEYRGELTDEEIERSFLRNVALSVTSGADFPSYKNENISCTLYNHLFFFLISPVGWG